MLRSPAECSRCGTVQPLIAWDDDGAAVCGPCVGFAADYTCRQCGRAGNPHSRGRCAHCLLAECVDILLAGPDGTVAPQLEPLAAALANAPSPVPAIQWIEESPNTKLLARLADVTGMHRHTATPRSAGSPTPNATWAKYLATRTEDQQEGRR